MSRLSNVKPAKRESVNEVDILYTLDIGADVLNRTQEKYTTSCASPSITVSLILTHSRV